MPHTENDLADCVGAIYEAAANGGSWESVGVRLCRLTDAQRAQLRMADRDGSARNVLMPVDESEAIYLTYYHLINPYLVRARRDFAEARTRHVGNVMLGPYGETLVVDWGLAKAGGRHEPETLPVGETPLQPTSASGSAPTHTRSSTHMATRSMPTVS